MIVRILARIGNLKQSRSLSSRVIQSSVWVVVGVAGQRGLQFVSNLILTRLLFPEAFGIMALATVFLVGLAMFSDIGLRPAIISDPRSRDPDFLNTAWTIQILRGLALFATGSILAYPVSLVYAEPVLFPLLVVMSLTAAISGLQTVGLATSERDLDFFKPTIISLSGQIISILTMAALAWYWRSVWALAVGNVIGTAATVAVGHWVLRGHSHQLNFNRNLAFSILRFGRWIFLSTVVTFVGGEGLRAVQARLLTFSEFGVLSIAYTIAVIATDLPTKLTGAIGLPALSEAYKDGHDRLASVLTNLRWRVVGLTMPAAVLAAACSAPLIALLYDPRYHGAGDYAALLILSNAVAVVFSGYLTATLALGQGKEYLFATSFISAARMVGTIAGFQIAGVMGMIAGILVANVASIFYFWASPSTKGLASYQFDVLSSSVPIFLVSAMMFYGFI